MNRVFNYIIKTNSLLVNNINYQSFIIQKISIIRNMSKTALILLANGAEELEFVSVVNILRRGQVKVTVAGVSGPESVKCRCDVVIVPDVSLADAATGSYDVIVLPGGLGGSKTLATSDLVGNLLKQQEKSEKLIAAICAAPTALKAHKIGFGKRITSYPAMKDELQKDNLYQYEESNPVVIDGNIITSRGPATAFLFALTILEKLQGKEKAKEVASAMLYEY